MYIRAGQFVWDGKNEKIAYAGSNLRTILRKFA